MDSLPDDEEALEVELDELVLERLDEDELALLRELELIAELLDDLLLEAELTTELTLELEDALLMLLAWLLALLLDWLLVELDTTLELVPPSAALLELSPTATPPFVHAASPACTTTSNTPIFTPRCNNISTSRTKRAINHIHSTYLRH